MSTVKHAVRRARRRREFSFAALVATAACLMLFVAAAGANLGNSLFESGDGNLLVDTDGNRDWANVGIDCASTPKVGCAIDKPTGQTDDSFGNGSDENNPAPSIVSGSIPNNKSDLLRFYIYDEKVEGDDLLYLAWQRVQEPTGTTNMDFELNQNKCVEGDSESVCSANGVTPVRTQGDVLIKYDLAQGGTNPVLGYHRWETAAGNPDAKKSTEISAICQAGNKFPCWGKVQALIGHFEGAINTGSVEDPILAPGQAEPRMLSARTFGEAAINLSKSGLFPAGRCLSFGSAYLKSRSSDSFTAALKDFIAPIPVTVSNCGTLTIKKVTVPAGDTTTSFGFTASGSPTTLNPASFSLTNGGTPRTFSDVLAGSYTVTENAPPAGWDFTGVECKRKDGSDADFSTGTRSATVTLAADEDVTCTFTNTKRGTVIVKKTMVGGTDSFGFTGTPSGSISTNNGTIQVPVSPGQYTSTEAEKAGWDLTAISCDDSDSGGDLATRTATFNVSAGETVTCTFTNAKHGKVIVKKAMVGGTGEFDFTGTPSGTISTNNGTIEAPVSPGQYTSTEAEKAGWDLTAISCDDADSTGNVAERKATFNVSAGETVTCTFTNEKHGRVVVKKAMVGGTDSFSFTGTPSGSISTNNGTIEADVSPGQYTSTEAEKSGWALTDISCDDGGLTPSSGNVAERKATFNVSAGEIVTCTFTNKRLALVKVEKATDPTTDSGTFNLLIGGTTYATGGHGTATEFIEVEPGSVTVSETGANGTSLADYRTSISCNSSKGGNSGQTSYSFSVDYGDQVTCTITNVRRTFAVVAYVCETTGGTATLHQSTVTLGGTQKSTQATLPNGVTAATLCGLAANFPGLHSGSHSATVGITP